MWRSEVTPRQKLHFKTSKLKKKQFCIPWSVIVQRNDSSNTAGHGLQQAQRRLAEDLNRHINARISKVNCLNEL